MTFKDQLYFEVFFFLILLTAEASHPSLLTLALIPNGGYLSPV